MRLPNTILPILRAGGKPIRSSLSIPSIHSQQRYASFYGYTQAKALVYSENGAPKDVLKLHKHSISPAYGKSITVKVLAAPINPSDINMIEGVYPARPPFTSLIGTALPSAVAGNEGCVEVVSCGSEVKNFKPGDWAIMRHTKFGTWRTYATAEEENLLKVPNDGSITPIQAATVTVNPCSAYRMLSDFWGEGKGIQHSTGEWVIQNGANSGVGRAVIQFAKVWGLKTINVVRERPDIMDLKKELKGLGADVVITDAELGKKTIKDNIEQWTEGKGLGLALNCVGGRSTTDMLRQLRTEGTMVTYGAMSRQPITVPASLFIFKDIRLRGFWLSVWNDKHEIEKQQMLDEIFDWTRKGWFKDAPVEKVEWKEDTTEESLKEAVERSMQGFGGKKRVFVMEST
ncbi:hypothetical protein DFH27DRAFT_526854 [Peziza echinospora]|nr:hypothetical protein DFH27DRAFT_526854 [Peziza echinospora]